MHECYAMQILETKKTKTTNNRDMKLKDHVIKTQLD